MSLGIAGFLRARGIDVYLGMIPDMRKRQIPVSDFRVWDAPSTVLPAAAANDDLGVIDNTYLTLAPTLQTIDAKAAGTTAYARVQVPALATTGKKALRLANIIINAGMKTTIADTSAVLDVDVVRTSAPTATLVTTAAQSINSLTAADKTFVVTADDIARDEILDIRISIVIVDGATGTAVIGKINQVWLEFKK